MKLVLPGVLLCGLRRGPLGGDHGERHLNHGERQLVQAKSSIHDAKKVWGHGTNPKCRSYDGRRLNGRHKWAGEQ